MNNNSFKDMTREELEKTAARLANLLQEAIDCHAPQRMADAPSEVDEDDIAALGDTLLEADGLLAKLGWGV